MTKTNQDRLFYTTEDSLTITEGNPTHIESADLTELDELREKILAAGQNQFTIIKETNKINRQFSTRINQHQKHNNKFRTFNKCFFSNF